MIISYMQHYKHYFIQYLFMYIFLYGNWNSSLKPQGEEIVCLYLSITFKCGLGCKYFSPGEKKNNSTFSYFSI